jgi:hypothetical protein
MIDMTQYWLRRSLEGARSVPLGTSAQGRKRTAVSALSTFPQHP